MEHQRAIQNLAVESYLLDEMTPEERDAFEEHYFECTVCADDVRAASRFMEDARETLRESPQAETRPLRHPAKHAPSQAEAPEDTRGRFSAGWLAWLKPQFAAPALAALLVLVGIQSLSIIPNLQRQVEEASSPHVAVAAVLRPATRGEVPRIAAPRGSAVLLTLDLPGTAVAGTPLQFVVESADGMEALRVPGDAPEPGLPVNLVIPHLDLPAGTYALVAEQLAASGNRGKEVARFSFQLEQK
jgi:anti-sigma factor RsiW